MSSDPQERDRAADAAQRLGTARGGLMAVGLMLAGDAELLAQAVPLSRALCAGLGLALGLAAGYALARAAFDASVFAGWAKATDLQASMAAFDQRWRRHVAAASPSLQTRIAGALRWHRRGLAATLAQALVTAAGLVPWPVTL